MPRMHVKEDICKGCELCINICPKHVIKISTTLNTMGYHPACYAGEGCNGCKSCAMICPDVAIEVFRDVKESASAQGSGATGPTTK